MYYTRIGSSRRICYAEKNGGVWQAFQFGPVLVQDGEITTRLKKNERQPRTIFGYVEPGHYIIVAVDGRTKTSIGMTEVEMAELMQSLGCTQAMNLDGGFSTSMLFMGETVNERVNDDRNVNDMLLFAEYDAGGTADRSVNSDHLAALVPGAELVEDLQTAEVVLRRRAAVFGAIVTAGARDPGLPVLARRLAGLHAQFTHHIRHAIGGKNTHQRIFHRQIEARRTGVTLTTRTAAQLVIDTA